MKRILRGSCLGLLLLAFFGCLLALLVTAVIFQQSQAVSLNAVASNTAQMTATHHVLPSTTKPTLLTSPIPIEYTGPSQDDVTIQVETVETTVPLNADGAITIVPDVLVNNATSTTIPELLITPTEVPRYSGTSSYPLTVTAEVMLAQTHVAHYQSGVAATRTAIAADSVGIFETLTASASIATLGAP